MNNFLRKYRLRKLAMGGFTMDRPELQSAKGEGIIGKSVLQGAMSGIGAGNSLFGAGSALSGAGGALAGAGGKAAGLLGKAGGPIGMAASVLAGAGIGLLTGSKQRKKQDEAYREQYENQVNEYNVAKSNYFTEKLNQDRQALIDRDNQMSNQFKLGGRIPKYFKGGMTDEDNPPKNLYSMDELMGRARQEANYMPTFSTLVAPSQKTQKAIQKPIRQEDYKKVAGNISVDQELESQKERSQIAEQPYKAMTPMEKRKNQYLFRQTFKIPEEMYKYKSENKPFGSDLTLASPANLDTAKNGGETSIVDYWRIMGHVLPPAALAGWYIRNKIKGRSTSLLPGRVIRLLRRAGSASKSAFPILNATGTILELLNEQKEYNKMTPQEREYYEKKKLRRLKKGHLIPLSEYENIVI